MENVIRIALPKGRLMEETVAALARVGITFPDLGKTKTLTLPDRSGQVEALVVRAADVPTYVVHGAADIGVVGEDTLWEFAERAELYELMTLDYGFCRLVLAVPVESAAEPIARVATKYPRTAEDYFRSRGRTVEVVKLAGSVELAARSGIADGIVDLVETGETLKANRLRIVEEIRTSRARLIANRTAYRTRYSRIDETVRLLEEIAGWKGEEKRT
ncbi:MAG: ATP phosphoribosyltransferase [Candidatus Hydrogenedentota bacterium]|nr:MAG: ATP phosphoribosyltransferase [Candidatus Hydrogenedentota bacterium]